MHTFGWKRIFILSGKCLGMELLAAEKRHLTQATELVLEQGALLWAPAVSESPHAALPTLIPAALCGLGMGMLHHHPPSGHLQAC